MDDRRFDSLVKSLAGGASRRSVLKGLLGLGGAAAIGGTLLEGPAEAARRPTPTPRPIRCPGNQTPVNGVCTCPTGLSQCNPGVGPACCNDTAVAPGSPTYSECCDNACCNGTCYGEELCCRTNSRAGGLPPTNRICDTVNGPECCLYSDECCLVDGCCATVCTGGSSGIDNCCPVEDFCPGAGESEDLCCTGNTTCCHGGTEKNACIDLTVEDACCDEGDCENPCKICSEDHLCVDRCDPETQVCCTEQAGPGVCVDGECCLGAPCGDEQVCCDTGEGTVCCPGGDTCVNNECTPPCIASSVQIFVQTHGPLEVPGVCPGPFANVVTEVGLYPYVNGACADTPIATATTSANGPAIFPNVPGGQYCALPTDGTIAGCLDCPDYGQGVGVNLTVPCSGTFQWTIGVDSCCVDGVDVDIFAGADDGACGQSSTIAGVELGLYDCDTDELLYGPVTTGADGRAHFEDVTPGHYCAHAAAGSPFSGCETCPSGGPSFDIDCNFGGWTVLFNDCGTCQVCSEGACIPAESGTSCPLVSDDDDEDTGICCDGQCLSSDEVCNGGECCPGGFCDGNGDCCLPPNVGCNGGACCDGFCDGNGDCCPAGHFGCNGGVCCDVECDTQGNCPSTPTCEPDCDCSDPANDGFDCNGGLENGGGVCACGWCVVPLDGCPCGCAGDTECVRCAGDGVCETYNQGGSCNEGAGVCADEWCVDAPPVSCEPNCDCTIEANDGLGCNGGLAGGGGVCAFACGGYCVVPIDECLCGCDGDTECIHCLGGQCVTYNEGGSCNGGAGACAGGYCV